MSEITLNYAGPVDLDTYGRYQPGGRPGPRYPFQGRTEARVPGRARPLPPLRRGGLSLRAAAAIVRSLKGLQDVVSLSYVDDDRDGRGWAFRERRGADPVNGFATLSEAYEATEPGLRRARLGADAVGQGDRADRQQQLPRHHDRPRHPVRR